MAESIEKPKLQRIVEHFQRFGVEFMIIGGAAAVLHGSPLPHAERMELGDAEALVIGLDDLVAIKRHLKRPKDQVALVQLEELQRLREDEGSEHE
jgi:hypothetical protein